MNEKKVLWKIVVGAFLVLVTVRNRWMYMNGLTQANAGPAMSAVAIFGGLCLIFRGMYPGQI